jgi:hypothetical protein
MRELRLGMHSAASPTRSYIERPYEFSMTNMIQCTSNACVPISEEWKNEEVTQVDFRLMAQAPKFSDALDFPATRPTVRPRHNTMPRYVNRANSNWAKVLTTPQRNNNAPGRPVWQQRYVHSITLHHTPHRPHQIRATAELASQVGRC